MTGWHLWADSRRRQWRLFYCGDKRNVNRKLSRSSSELKDCVMRDGMFRNEFEWRNTTSNQLFSRNRISPKTSKRHAICSLWLYAANRDNFRRILDGQAWTSLFLCFRRRVLICFVFLCVYISPFFLDTIYFRSKIGHTLQGKAKKAVQVVVCYCGTYLCVWCNLMQYEGSEIIDMFLNRLNCFISSRG